MVATKKRLTLKRHNELLIAAINRYLELCREGSERGVCEEGEHADDCPLADRPCVLNTGGLCHWCELDAAVMGEDWRDYEENRNQATE